MEKLSELPNIGVALERQLNEIGINTPEQLRSVGSKKAWRMILAKDSSACMLRLMALEGAVQGVNKNMLSDETKAVLKKFYRAVKDKQP